ncbi:LacI family DNA-binding transcriptional regulator [Actinomadura madurae]|uniref:LacI family DNA-binding transcriptional regulator n=1 Tax=Actinomadura madurae TaxID=1993 RepID=UPI000D88908A|nr:LacI family DNA-binding transcriptional regulator [Actinomadura madurae]SPT51246.1 HTH-type transcriptional repressor CytR [Actinomadura madurae]
MKKVTSFDVAKLAGVSQPTVSRALRNLPGTSVETRRKVLEAAAELSYIPSDSARSLSTTRSRRIAVVAEELTNPYYPELVEPIRRHLARHDLRTVVVTDSEHREVGPETLADGSYDGVILMTTLRTSALPRDLTERGIPHVLVNRVLDQPESPSCSVDNTAGARMIAELLADLGHRRVGLLQGPVATSTGRERAESLRKALRTRGIHVRRDAMARTAFEHDAGRVAAGRLLDRAERPSAIVGGNDVIALGVLSAARERGLRVPEDLTVIGFDDIPMAGWPLIGLTTVHCDLERLAGTAVDLLRSAMSTPGPAKVERIPVSLVLRGTHGPSPE